jgi:hypothetical protein
MFRRLILATILLFVTSSPLLLSGCREQPNDQLSTQPSINNPAVLVDSLENRRNEAYRFVAVYSAAEFAADLAEQAAEIVGQEVVEDARMKLKQRFSAQGFSEVRIKLLVQNFSAVEITKLTEISSSREGKSLMRKLIRYNEDWRKFLTPVILESLSNMPQN